MRGRGPAGKGLLPCRKTPEELCWLQWYRRLVEIPRPGVTWLSPISCDTRVLPLTPVLFCKMGSLEAPRPNRAHFTTSVSKPSLSAQLTSPRGWTHISTGVPSRSRDTPRPSRLRTLPRLLSTGMPSPDPLPCSVGRAFLPTSNWAGRLLPPRFCLAHLSPFEKPSWCVGSLVLLSASTGRLGLTRPLPRGTQEALLRLGAATRMLLPGQQENRPPAHLCHRPLNSLAGLRPGSCNRTPG